MIFRKRADNANTTVLPQPLNVAASGEYDGNDGKWSSFYINLGDDASGSGQNFKVLISTSSPITLVPQQSEWCNQDCAGKRGVQVFNGEPSLGFDTDSSHAWKDAGTFNIPLPHWWSGNSSLSGLWGSENVGLGESSKQSPILADQSVVAYTFDNFFMGSFGLAAGQINTGAGAKPPFLYNLAKAGSPPIPSVSYGYTAGAFYRNNHNGAVGSLVLGGYDQTRVKLDSNSGISIGMPNDKNNTLVVGVPSILYKPDSDVEANDFSFTSESKGFSASIDSTLPYLWLPDPVCDQFAEKFQLDYDEKGNWYTVNDTAHRNNQQQNATVSFKIANGPQDSNDFATINLPYDAFDLELDRPIKDNSTKYFPLKKSPNGMFVLGRTFLQEAYIIVDYERTNFTVAPAVSSDTMQEPKLIPIYNTTFSPPGSSPTVIPSGGGGKGGLAPGAVAGIVVGIVVVFLLAGVGAFFYWKKRREEKNKVLHAEKASEIDTVVAGNEVKHRRVSELDSEPPGSPKPSLGGFYANGEHKDPFPAISEMESPPAELYSPPVSSPPMSDGNGADYFATGKVRRRGATRESSGNNTPGAPTPSPLAELPGDDGHYQVGGMHFEPVPSPKASPAQTRSTSQNSLRTNIDEVMKRPDASPDRRGESQSAAIAEESEEAEKAEKKEQKEGASEDDGGEPGQTLERRPSHARGLSDTTIHSESTAVSQPSPEELERWAMGEEDGPRRPLSE